MIDLFIRRLIGVVQIYGGVSGAVLGIRGLSTMRYSVPELVATLAFLGLFLWGLIAGVRLLERRGGVRSAM